MNRLYSGTITEIGPDVPDLLEGGLLILFSAGAPAELAEISVLHTADPVAEAAEPAIGDIVRFGGVHESRITSLGERAWAKARELGHLTFSFNGSAIAERPGEICVTPLPAAALLETLQPGRTIEVLRD